MRQSLNKDGAKPTDDEKAADGSAFTAAQLDNLRKIFDRLGMQYVDKVVLDGVPVSALVRISEIVKRLFERKKIKNDFDVIAWQIPDLAASRGGGKHGMWLEHEANRNRLLIFYPGDEAPDGEYASVVRVVKYEAAKESSVSTGRRSTQGQKWAQKQGFFRTAVPMPMGCDRIYYGEDDKPKFIIRNLPDGRQEQWEYPSLRVIGRYGTAEKKSKNRFKKQANEYSLLYPATGSAGGWFVSSSTCDTNADGAATKSRTISTASAYRRRRARSGRTARCRSSMKTKPTPA